MNLTISCINVFRINSSSKAAAILYLRQRHRQKNIYSELKNNAIYITISNREKKLDGTKSQIDKGGNFT